MVATFAQVILIDTCVDCRSLSYHHHTNPTVYVLYDPTRVEFPCFACACIRSCYPSRHSLFIESEKMFVTSRSSSLAVSGCRLFESSRYVRRLRQGACRIKSTAAPPAEEAAVVPPTSTQLWRLFINTSVPMVVFGITDQTVMIQAGNAIDCTLGVTFALSTLTAAAFGQVISDASGVIFGGTVERLAKAAGLPGANLTLAQRKLPIVSQVRFAGNLLGIIFGCCLGLVNLLFIDTDRSSTLKLQAFSEEQEFEFTIEASNAVRENATTLTVRGPDVDGLMASMTAALAVRGCSILEIHAQRAHPNEEQDTEIQDVFSVIKRETGKQFDDDELEPLAQGLLDSTRTPMNVNSVKAAMHELESTNSFLQARVKKLERIMYERQITLVSSSGAASRPGGTGA
jgi:hypothetical protein